MEVSNDPTLDRDAEQRLALASWYYRRSHRVFWTFPLSAGLIAVFIVLMLRGAVEDPRANYTNSYNALMAIAPKPVSKLENAWEDYKAAQVARALFTGNTDDMPLYHTDDESPFFDTPGAIAYWQSNAQCIQLLNAGAQKERCDWGIDYTLVPWALPSLMTIRENAEMLAVDARVRARRGDHAGAAASLASMRKLARHVASEPTLLNAMMADAVESISNDAMEAILIWDPPSADTDLQAYRQALAFRAEPCDLIAHAMDGERWGDLCRLDAYHSGTKAALAPGLNAPALTYASDRQCFEQVMAAMIADLRSGRVPEESRTLIARYQTGPIYFADRVLPSANRHYWIAAEVYDKAVALEVALGVLQFRLTNKRDPKSLDELVPTCFPAVPTGVVKTKPVRLRRNYHANGDWPPATKGLKDKPLFCIYTVGPDGKDDHASSTYQDGDSAGDDVSVLLPELPEAPRK